MMDFKTLVERRPDFAALYIQARTLRSVPPYEGTSCPLFALVRKYGTTEREAAEAYIMEALGLKGSRFLMGAHSDKTREIGRAGKRKL